MEQKDSAKGLRTSRSIMPWIVWLLAVGFYAYEFLQRVSISVFLSQMLTDLQTNAARIGLLSSCYYYAYAIMQLPAGTLVDRYGPKKLVLTGLILVVIGTLWFSTINSVGAGAAARFLIGMGSAFAFVCTLQFIIIWFPQGRFAQLAGLTNFMGYIGATAGEVPLAMAVHKIGWRDTAFYTVFIGILLFILIAVIVKDKPVPHKLSPSCHHKQKIPSMFKGLQHVLGNARNWFNGAYCGLMVGPTSAFAALWGLKFLVTADHVSHKIAAGALSIIFFGVAVGSPLFGWLSDRINKRQIFLIFSAILGLICTALIIFINDMPVALLYTICFLFGFAQSAHVLTFANAKDSNHRNYSGTAISFVNMSLIIGGALLQPIIGILLDWVQNQDSVTLTNVYSASSFHIALAVIPLCQLAAFVIALLFLKDK
ncbi:MAG: MFS transporter [Coxiellaceae bacterium]|nr:MFS transporter [Coxiellaceae bacterium]